MVNVKDRTCHIENCITIPCFNYLNESKSIYCNKHKLENMVNVKDKKCEALNCNIPTKLIILKVLPKLNSVENIN